MESENHMGDLMEKTKGNGKDIGSDFRNRISVMQQKNKELIKRLESCQWNRSNPATVSRGFGYVTDGPGQALKDPSIINKI